MSLALQPVGKQPHTALQSDSIHCPGHGRQIKGAQLHLRIMLQYILNVPLILNPRKGTGGIEQHPARL